MGDAAALRGRVLEEAERFRALIPSLRERWADQWVVFHDGAVVSAHASEDEAYLAAVERLGRDACWVIGDLRGPECIVLNAAAHLGL